VCHIGIENRTGQTRKLLDSRQSPDNKKLKQPENSLEKSRKSVDIKAKEKPSEFWEKPGDQ